MKPIDKGDRNILVLKWPWGDDLEVSMWSSVVEGDEGFIDPSGRLLSF